MNTLVIVLIAAVVLVAAYALYGRWLAKTWGIDPKAQTPAHMKSVATSAGKYVKQGELIGYVGSTGNSTGNHLHLEVWKGGSKANAVNPRGYIPFPHN